MSYQSEVLADTPLGYWHLDETSGTTITDSSGNAHNGTITTVSSAAGRVGTALSVINSRSNGVTVANASWINVTQFSVECWIYPTNTTSATRCIVMRADDVQSASGQGWQLSYDESSKKITFTVLSGSSVLTCAGTANAMQLNNWYHLVGTSDAATMRLYVNGVEVANAASAACNTPATPLTFGMPGVASARYLGGRIDEVAFYSGALSATRVAAHYNATIRTLALDPVAIEVSLSGITPTMIGTRQYGWGAGWS